MLFQLLENKELSPIIGAAFGAGATLLAVVVTGSINILLARMNQKSQQRQKEQELQLAKLEELYFIFEKWETAVTNIYLMHLRNYAGKLSYGQVLELNKENPMLSPGDAQRYKMLIEIYFPGLVPAYKLVDAARAKNVPFLDDAERTKLPKRQFIECQEEFESACKDFKKSVAALAHGKLK